MASNDKSPGVSQMVRELFDAYETHKCAEINTRRFTQAEMVGWLQPMLDRNTVRPTPLGASAEGRTITLYSYGTGPVKVLLWSQMHGDEPTATMALLDILNYFARRPDDPVVRTIRDGLTLLMIPMLNPDGAERFTRRTAQLVDMNRDAVALVTPEANILKNTRDTYGPEFGFNLHDQEPRLTVGTTKEVTAVALLAPAMNEARGDNDVRKKAKKVASVFAGVLNELVPGHAAKYDDAFDARAFGDSVQRAGTSTVLVESGGWPNDRDKMSIRKLNYVGLLVSLSAIATRDYERADPATYESLPFNTKNLYDLIVRGIGLKTADKVQTVQVDVAFNIEEERQDDGHLGLVAKVVDIGDLSRYGAFEERNGHGKTMTGQKIGLDRKFSPDQLELLLK